MSGDIDITPPIPCDTCGGIYYHMPDCKLGKPVPEVLYFGRLDVAGHSLHSKTRHVSFNDQPWGTSLDGGILIASGVKDEPANGIVAVARGAFLMPPDAKHVFWTCISFWDRSGDSRPNSNSAFLVMMDMAPIDLLEYAKAKWPEVFSRTNFPVLKKLRWNEDIPVKVYDKIVVGPPDLEPG